MEDIINYKVSQFLRKDIKVIEQYINVLKYLKPYETKKKIFDLRLRDVQDTKDNLAAGTFEDIIKCVMLTEELTYEEVLKMGIVEFWGLVKSITKQIEDINHMESVSLTSEYPNFKWEAVGGSEKLSKFGIYNTLDKLSDGDILKYEAILDLPYADVFVKLYMDRIKGDLQHEMSQLKTRR